MKYGDHIDIDKFRFDGRTVVKIHAGHRGTEHIEPPGGPRYAFDRDRWAREVEVYVSPTGRSVRVWVDGVEVTR